MAITAEVYWAKIKASDEVGEAEEWLHRITREHTTRGRRRTEVLDPHTARHSRRVAVSSAILSFEATIDIEIATAMAAGALLHDSGKRLHTVLGLENADMSHPFARYSQQRHPHDSWLDAHRVWPGASEGIRRWAKLFTLTHHTNFTRPTQRYPSALQLETYIAAKDVGPQELDNVAEFSPILTTADHLDALTHPEERPYMHERLVAAGVDRTDRNQLLNYAVDEARKDLLPPGSGLTIGLAAVALTEHFDLIESYARSGEGT